MPKIKKEFSPQELEACLLTLEGEETTAQQVVLRDLCPCRSRCYDHGLARHLPRFRQPRGRGAASGGTRAGNAAGTRKNRRTVAGTTGLAAGAACVRTFARTPGDTAQKDREQSESRKRK